MTKELTTKQKLAKIDEWYSLKADIMLGEALASCAIEGNPMKSRVGKVFGYLWFGKPIPSDEVVDSVYNLFKMLPIKGKE